jgi:subtilisin family serine protease
MIRACRNCLPLLVLALVALPAAPPSGAGLRAAPVLAPGAARALADPAHPARLADGRLKVWVRFHDKGVSSGDLPAALAAARGGLSPRALARRERTSGASAVVDGRDLPLSPRYLARAAATGARLHRQSRWLNAASYLADDEQVRRLAALPEVDAIDLVARFRRAAVPTPVPEPALAPLPDVKAATAIDYGANAAAMLQANVPAAHEQLRLSGAGVVVGMLDTGFRTTHEALVHIPVLGAWDFVNDDPIVDNEGSDPAGSRSHGTMTLSTVAAWKPGQLVAPAWGVAVLLGKTEDISQEVPIEEDHWVAGLEWAEAQGADIISSSLGYIDWYTFADLDGNTCVTTIAADLAAGRGLVIVNSAGNERARTGHLIAPADGDSVITVGAVDAAGVVTSFSSPGPTADGRVKPDVVALGAGNRVANPNDDAGYVNVSGTSFSCPLTSGVVALMLERVPGLTPVEVAEALRQTASHPTVPNNDSGWGVIDAYAAATWFGPVFTHAPLADPQLAPGPYFISATITARLGLAATPQLAWRADAGPWHLATMIPNGPPALYSGALPAVAGGTTVQYYLTASDAGGHVSHWPPRGAAAPFTFTVPLGTSPAGDVPDRGPAWLDAAAPNPFNPRTTLRFGLAAAGPARLEIFDARGRLVRRLLDADLPAGDHACAWDGRGDDGRAAPSGVYLARLRAGGTARQQKLQLVR